MSREIKFRAWYKDVMRGKKVGDDIIWSKTSYYDYDPIVDNKGLCAVESGWDIQGHEDKNDYTLEQYTGLKDKNGKEIYEGDIVEGDMGVFEVMWYDSVAQFMFRPNIDMKWHPPFVYDQVNEMEVIGNIHENPELLEGER